MSSATAPAQLVNDFSKYATTIYTWGGFLSVSLIIYFLFSSGDFSFLLTYASVMRCFGLGQLVFGMWHNRTANGISVKSLQAYAVVFTARLLSILRHQGYLPFDKSGDWFYHFVETMSLIIVIGSTVMIYKVFISTYDQKHDKFGNFKIPNEYGVLYLIVPCFLAAMLFHPSLNHEWFSDVMWTLSMYLEAVAMFPQLYLFQRMASESSITIEGFIGHSVFALSFSRLFELIFWAYSYQELTGHKGDGISGYLVMLAQLTQLVIMGDYFYYYFKSLAKGVPMELPATHSPTADV